PRSPRASPARTARARAPPGDSGSGRSARRCALGLEAPQPRLELIEILVGRGRPGLRTRRTPARAPRRGSAAPAAAGPAPRAAEELVERKTPGGRGPRCRRRAGLGPARSFPPPLLPEHRVERKCIG